MSRLTFPTVLIYGLLYGSPALWKLGEPFSWLTHLLLGYRLTLLFRCSSPRRCGELAGKRLFPVCGFLPTCKVSYINKLKCFCFVGKRKEKKMKVCLCKVLLLRGGLKKRMRPKFLEHSFVREFAVIVFLSFSDLWVYFGGGFQTKQMVLRPLIYGTGTSHISRWSFYPFF